MQRRVVTSSKLQFNSSINESTLQLDGISKMGVKQKRCKIKGQKLRPEEYDGISPCKTRLLSISEAKMDMQPTQFMFTIIFKKKNVFKVNQLLSKNSIFLSHLELENQIDKFDQNFLKPLVVILNYVPLNCLFYLGFHTQCHKIDNHPPLLA